MERLSIESISVFGLPPVEYVHLAADLGLRYISLSLAPFDLIPTGYPRWSLMEDAALRRELKAAMRDRGVSIGCGEGLSMREDMGPKERTPEFEVMLELGVKRINVVSRDPDMTRSFDKYAGMAELAGKAGVDVVTEFAPGLTVEDLPTALKAVRHVNRPNFTLLMDTMHFCRTGGTVADIQALDPKLIGYIQLCDAAASGPMETYMEEALTRRFAPGEGELPLYEVMAALPRDLLVGLEIPQLAKMQAGLGPMERMRPCVEAARALLARLP
jgi:sugar phosphate isomerase/epimerase